MTVIIMQINVSKECVKHSVLEVHRDKHWHTQQRSSRIFISCFWFEFFFFLFAARNTAASGHMTFFFPPLTLKAYLPASWATVLLGPLLQHSLHWVFFKSKHVCFSSNPSQTGKRKTHMYLCWVHTTVTSLWEVFPSLNFSEQEILVGWVSRAHPVWSFCQCVFWHPMFHCFSPLLLLSLIFQFYLYTVSFHCFFYWSTSYP